MLDSTRETIVIRHPRGQCYDFWKCKIVRITLCSSSRSSGVNGDVKSIYVRRISYFIQDRVESICESPTELVFSAKVFLVKSTSSLNGIEYEFALYLIIVRNTFQFIYLKLFFFFVFHRRYQYEVISLLNINAANSMRLDRLI